MSPRDSNNYSAGGNNKVAGRRARACGTNKSSVRVCEAHESGSDEPPQDASGAFDGVARGVDWRARSPRSSIEGGARKRALTLRRTRALDARASKPEVEGGRARARSQSRRSCINSDRNNNNNSSNRIKWSRSTT